MVTNSVGDGFAWLLLAFGVTFQPHEYWGGLFFAFGCAMLARHFVEQKDRRAIWVTLLSAFIVATFGGQIFFAQFPDSALAKQAVMAGLGLTSPVITAIVMRVLQQAEARQAEIADALIDRVMPKDKDDDK